jgi:hypothetical protein
MHTSYWSRHVCLLAIAGALASALTGCSAADENDSGEETQSVAPTVVKERAADVLAQRALPTKERPVTIDYEAAPEVQTRSGNVGLPRGAVTSDQPCEDEGDCTTWHTPHCYLNLEQCYQGLCVMKKKAGCTP